MIEIIFFESPTEPRKWFEKNRADGVELWVGYYKKNSGKPSVTWPESVDEALCVGWIDGIRKSIDEISYTIRFTDSANQRIIPQFTRDKKPKDQ